MFEQLSRLPEDPILGVMSRYRADPAPLKIDLGVGVYRDVTGATPVLDVVRRAERELIAAQTTKSYVAPAGRAEFNAAVGDLVLGPRHPALAGGRARTVQAPGGCGALRLGAELIRIAAPGATVFVSDPTWGNHVPLLGGSGLKLERYPYYDGANHRLRFDAMLARLDGAMAGDVVLLHACCHNPTGADLAGAQWRELLGLLVQRRLVPFLDLAYLGFGENLEADAEALRLVAAEVPEALIAVSFSKNLGLYRERTGALIAIGETPAQGDAALSHLLQVARSIYSMPPDHGAAIAAAILSGVELRKSWEHELAGMRERMRAMRALLADRLRETTAGGGFEFIRTQRGMFSLLGLSPAQVDRLRDQHHVYMTADSRINVAGVMPHNAQLLAESIAAVLKP
jgi:aspartate/tyrosine/aromatic aminotransferase